MRRTVMRQTVIRRAAALAMVLAAAALPVAVNAQNPSSREIIKALRPGNDAVTRGIRPIAPGAATPGAPAQAAPAQPGAQVTGAPSVNLTVTFATGSAELTAPAMRTLDELGRALSSPDLAGFRFRVEGHTDTVGTAALNQSLSDRRAAAVVQYLTSRFGIPAARLEAVGLGESQPLVATGDEVAEPRNRRVQVVNIGT
jgi:OOP family OmpA-OmpF porin